jgi:hypothetical protein
MIISELFKRRVVFVLIIVMLSGCTTMMAPQKVKDYCKRISGTEDLGSSIVRACLEQEMNAKKKLSKMEIPWQVEKYCREISDRTGGSYQVMLACVEEELRD